MKKLYIIIFCIIAIILCVLLIGRSKFFPEKSTITTSKVITPGSSSQDTQDIDKTKTDEQLNSTNLTAFVPMQSDETLIATHSSDINNDTYEDQIIAVKRANNPYIMVVVGLYSPKLTHYLRTCEIPTEITQVKTFTLTTLDITGERINTIIYTGFSDNNDSILQAYNGKISQDIGFELVQIADLKSNGTIFIEPVTRTAAYDMSLVSGQSYPIWVYSTDDENGQNTYDQIQSRYIWNSLEQKYLKDYETRVTGKKIATKELQRIQDGTVETFMAFLDGLWYKTSSKTGETRYLFFDKDQNEIIFLLDQIQEIYTTINSTLRRNGIYISTTNKSIQNLTRRLDISLVGTEEIRIKLRDDLRMLIGEETVWDGNYKKMTSRSSTNKSTKQIDKNLIIKTLKTNKEPWRFSDGSSIEFLENKFIIQKENTTQEGTFFLVESNEKILIQCKSNNTALPDGFYSINIIDDNKKSSVKILELIPANVNLTGHYPSGKPIIKLETPFN